MAQRNKPWPAGTPCWVDLAVTDLGRTQEFYRSVLGWEYGPPRPEHGGYCTALVEGGPVAGLSPAVPDLQDVPHVWQVYLAAREARSCGERAVAAGATQLMEPTEVGPLGTMGLYTDPTGASFGTWEAGEHLGFTVTDVPGAVTWCDLVTPDVATARDFYAQLFGYNYEDAGRDGPPYAVFTVPGGDAPGGGIGGTDPGAGHAVAVWSVCFRSDDVGTAVQRAREAGGSVLEEPFDVEYGRLAVVGGPDRESFAIMTPADPAQRSGRSRPAVRGGS
ncbi:VOC family protein [Kocuria rosea]|uniref:VOC family protein n=1 Tax=Kocuria rosea TaxID=1275 RepID=UPI00203C876D|nr:VOC family protein [Kocuria rosea]MCM3687063.1 VOC family protein [Kocuria rosea]